MYATLNVGKKIITQFSWKSRDESFEPSWSTIRQYLPNKMKVILFIGLRIFLQSRQAAEAKSYRLDTVTRREFSARGGVLALQHGARLLAE
jgi:hypothetical protein